MVTFFLGWFLFTRLVFFAPFMVAGASMEPTFYNGQIFILDEAAESKENLQRGDIVVFYFADKPSYYYIKRVVGLPGEKVVVKNDGIYIENSEKNFKLDEPYLKNVADSAKGVYTYKPYFLQTYAVPKDKYFVLGDNRFHSLDSRSFKNPYISKNQIKGKYVFTLLPTLTIF